jgi:ketosteroid isomerase-like protein
LRLTKAQIILAAIVFAITSLTILQAQERKVIDSRHAQAEVVEAILKLEHETMEAIKRKDPAALGKILADDFIHRSPGGEQARKEEFLKTIASLPVIIDDIWGENLNVDVFGDTAILTGVQRVKTKSADGKMEEGAGAFTDVFVRRGDRWLMVLAYSVDIPVPTNTTKDDRRGQRS